MPDKVFANGRAIVHKKSDGKSIAFPDVCLCPPTPPAGPVPVPLPNTVIALDLENGARSVLISDSPAGTRKSFFKKSMGNEVALPTGGGILSKTVQGSARFRFGHSMNVFIEGEPATRHLDPLEHNCLGPQSNTPPAPWISTMDVTPTPPTKLTKQLSEAKEADWIGLRLVDEAEQPVSGTVFKLKTPKGQVVEGRLLGAGVLAVSGIAKGRCELTLPKVDDTCARLKRRDAPKPRKDEVPYRPGVALVLESGKEHLVVVPGMVSLWVDLPIRARAADARDDRFVLSSTDGSYQVVRTVKDDRVHGDGGLTLEFEGLRPGLKYSLHHDTGKDGVVYALFEDRGFDSLVRPEDSVDPEEVCEPGWDTEKPVGETAIDFFEVLPEDDGED
jgi:hypothetical protein